MNLRVCRFSSIVQMAAGLMLGSVAGQVAMPVFDHESGMYATRLEVAVDCPMPEVTIHYTTDGSVPGESDPVVASGAAVPVGGSLILKARAYRAGYLPSEVATAEYRITGMISAGGKHMAAVRSDRTVWAWGAQSDGRLGNGASSGDAALPERVDADASSVFGPVWSVSAGSDFTLIIDADATLWACGAGDAGRLGNNATSPDAVYPVRVLQSADPGDYLTGIEQASAGKAHSLAVSATGAVYAWGSGDDGRLGNGLSSGSQTWAAPVRTAEAGNPVLMDAVEVRAGGSFSVVRDASGHLWVFGGNSQSQLGQGANNTTPSAYAVKVVSPDGTGYLGEVEDMAAGDEHVVALRRSAQENGTVWCWGERAHGRLGDGFSGTGSGTVGLPGRVRKSAAQGGGYLDGIAEVAAGFSHSVALDNSGGDGSGRVWTWGDNRTGQLGDGTTTSRGTADLVRLEDGSVLDGIVTVGAGGYDDSASGVCRGFSCAVDKNGVVYVWGDNAYGQYGDGTTITRKFATAVDGPGSLRLSNGSPTAFQSGSLASTQFLSAEESGSYAYAMGASVLVYNPFDMGLPDQTGLHGQAVLAQGFSGNYSVSFTAADQSNPGTGYVRYTTAGNSFAEDPNAPIATGALVLNTTSGTANTKWRVQKVTAQINAVATGTVYMRYDVVYPEENFNGANYTYTHVNAGGLCTSLSIAVNGVGDKVGVGFGLADTTNATVFEPVANTPYLAVAKFTHVGEALSAGNVGEAYLWVFDELSYFNWSQAGGNEADLDAYAIATAYSSKNSGTYTLDGTWLNDVRSNNNASRPTTQVLDNFIVATALADVAKPAWTPSIPWGMTAGDIGSPTTAGGSSYAGSTETWSVSGAGTGIDAGATSEQFQFLRYGTAGDGNIVAQVMTQQNTGSTAKAGVMARAGTASNAAYAAVLRAPNNTITFQYRTSAGAAAGSASVANVSGPVYLKLTRAGNAWAGYYSTDGQTYAQIGSAQTITGLNGNYDAGLAASSDIAGSTSLATFKNFSAPLNLISNGTVNYQIHLFDSSNAVLNAAANELQSYLGDISGGADPAISYNWGPTSGPQIILGEYNMMTDVLAPNIDYAGLDSEGFVIKVVGPNIIIANTTDGGTQYGALWFLDRMLGVHWLSPDVTHVPHAPNLTLDSTVAQTRQTPRFTFRQVLSQDGQNQAFAWRNLLNGKTHGVASAPTPPGSTNWDKSWGWTYMRRSLKELAPDYGSAQQVQMMSSACRQQIAGNIVEILHTMNAETIASNYFTVIINDFGGWSPDAASRDFANQHGGSLAAPMLDMINDVLVRVRQVYPTAKIAYKAYQWGFTPPTGMTISQGVMPIQMDIHLDQSAPFSEGGYNAKLAQDVVAWNDLVTASNSDSMVFFDHTTNFQATFTPTPNIYPIAENIRFLADLENYHGYFAEGFHWSHDGDFGALKAWLTARMTWDPNTDINAAVATWCNEYYGAAGTHVKQYIDLTQQHSDSTGSPAWEKDGIENAMYTVEYAKAADALFASAAAAVSGNPTLLARVNLARLSVDNLILQRRAEYAYKDPTFNIDFTNRRARLEATINANGITLHGQALSVNDLYDIIDTPRTYPATVPSFVSGISNTAWYAVQDYDFFRFNGMSNCFVSDSRASDGVAIKIPSIQGRASYKSQNLPNDGGQYEVWVAVRADIVPGANSSTEVLKIFEEFAPGNQEMKITAGQLADGEYHYFKVINGPHGYINTDYSGISFTAQTLSSSVLTGLYVDQMIVVRLPDAPAVVSATPASYKQVSLTWDASDGATAYEVYRSTTPGSLGSRIASGLTGTSYSDAGLTPGTTYYYTIRALNVAGTGQSSTQVAVTTNPADIDVSMSFAYAGLADGQGINDWPAVPPGDNVDYGLAGNLAVVALENDAGSSGSGTYAATGLSFGSNYRTPTSGALVTTAKTGANSQCRAEAIQASLTGAPSGTVYVSYLTRLNGSTWPTGNAYSYLQTNLGDLRTSFNARNPSGQNSVAVGFGGISTGSVFAPQVGTTYLVLAKFTRVGEELSTGNQGEARLWVLTQTQYDNWYNAGAVEADLGSYTNITATQTKDNGTYNLAGTFSNVARSASNGGFTIIQALDEVRVGGSLADVLTALTAPAGVTATAVSDTRIDLAWEAVAGATGYNIYRGTTSGGQGSTPLTTVGSGQAAYSDLNLSPSTTYYYTVQAVGLPTNSSQSAEAFATTESPPDGTVAANLGFNYANLPDGQNIGGQAMVPAGDSTDFGFSGNYSYSYTNKGGSGYARYRASGLNNFGEVGSGGALALNATCGSSNSQIFAVSVSGSIDAQLTGTVYMSYQVVYTQDGFQNFNGYSYNKVIAGGLQTAMVMRSGSSNALGVGYGTVVAGATFNPDPNTPYLAIARFTNIGTALTPQNPGYANLWLFDEASYANWLAAGGSEADLDAYAFKTASASATSNTYTLDGTWINSLRSDNHANAATTQVLDGFRVGTTLDTVMPSRGYSVANLEADDAQPDGDPLNGQVIIPPGDSADLGFSGRFTIAASDNPAIAPENRGYGSATYTTTGLSHFGSSDLSGAIVLNATSGDSQASPWHVQTIRAQLDAQPTGTAYTACEVFYYLNGTWTNTLRSRATSPPRRFSMASGPEACCPMLSSARLA